MIVDDVVDTLLHPANAFAVNVIVLPLSDAAKVLVNVLPFVFALLYVQVYEATLFPLAFKLKLLPTQYGELKPLIDTLLGALFTCTFAVFEDTLGHAPLALDTCTLYVNAPAVVVLA